jgi:ABC-type nitrate/sulfonate/bicarbonate transport system substrate-binding protein
VVSPVCCGSLGPDTVVAGSYDGALRFYSADTCAALGEAGAHEGPIKAVAAVPGGRRRTAFVALRRVMLDALTDYAWFVQRRA